MRTTAAVLLAVLLSVPATAGTAAPPSDHVSPGRSLHLPTATKAKALKQAAATPGDVTGDGKADAVVRDPGPDSGMLRLYAHDGSTTANPWSTYTGAGGPWDFADLLQVGDVTGDGRPDLVAREPGRDNGTLWVYVNNGTTWTDRYSAGTGWNAVNTIFLADVTGDGRTDLLARQPGLDNGTLWVYPHNGSATSNPWTLPRMWQGTGWNIATGLANGDITGDGRADMVLRDSSGTLWIYPHNGNTTGNFYVVPRFAAGTGWNLANAILTGDVTGDGHADLVIRDGAGALWVYPHNGAATGNPYTLPRYPAGTGWGIANALMITDLTGDGRPDMLARVHAGDLWVYPNDGSTPWAARFAAGDRWTFENQMLLGDVTGDGRPDIVARDPAVADGTLWVYANTGATTSDPWTAAPVFAGTGWNLATAMALADLTGDGRPDLVARDRNGDLWVYPHNGSATGNHWTAGRMWAGTGWNTATALALGNVSGDSRPDLVDQESDGSLWIYVTGSSGAPIRVTGDWSGTTALALGDVDGDGRLDLVTRDSPGALSVRVHDGATNGNPWSAARPAGTGWGFASAFLLS